MSRKYPDDQCVRAIMRSFPKKDDNKNKKGLDIGCGAGRHAAVMVEMGFNVKAIDIMPQSISETLLTLENYPKEKIQVECADFLRVSEKEMYDLVIAWHCLYAYNNSLDDCPNKIRKIHTLLKPNGKIIMSLKSKEDSLFKTGNRKENGLMDNAAYNTPGYVFYSQEEMVEVITECGFAIDYIEKFSRSHTLKRQTFTTNEMWKNVELDTQEYWYAICATKI